MENLKFHKVDQSFDQDCNYTAEHSSFPKELKYKYLKYVKAYYYWIEEDSIL